MSTIVVEDIARATAAHYGLTLDELRGERRQRRFAWPRQTAMYLARRMTPSSLKRIGRYFSRDHTTVLCAVVAIDERLGRHIPREDVETIAEDARTRAGFRRARNLHASAAVRAAHLIATGDLHPGHS